VKANLAIAKLCWNQHTNLSRQVQSLLKGFYFPSYNTILAEERCRYLRY
jgi:hypothetical protein